MKARWFPIFAFACLASCDEEPSASPPPPAERKMPSPSKIVEPGDSPDASAGGAGAPQPAPGGEAGAVTRKTDLVPLPTVPPPPEPPPLPKTDPAEVVAAGGVPEAKAVPGKGGFVFSPHSNKIVDVRDLPPGTLVADPTFPADQKKHFRVPK